MKKITKILLIIMMIFINIGLVKAEGLNIKLESITVKEKSSTITVEDPVISGDDVTSNITFNEKDDYVIFTLTFKNNESEKYKITSLEDNNETSNIDIEYDFSDEYIESGSSGTVDIKITYKETLLNQASLSLDNLSITVNLEKGDSSTSTIVINPITGDSIIHYVLILVVCIAGIGLIVFKKKRIGSLLVIASILLIPVTTFALIKFNFQFKFTGIKIIGQFENYNVSISVGDSSEPTIRNITYGQPIGELPSAAIKEGHTFSKYVDENNNEVTSETIITGPISISPIYTKNSYNVTVNNSQNVSEGNVSGLYEYGSVITLTAIAREGYTFTKWSNGSTDNPLELVVGASDIEIEPIYTEDGPILATFKTGEEVNTQMKKLANPSNTNIYYLSSDISIRSIKKSTVAPDLNQMTDANIVSTDDSEAPIYIWWDDSSSTIYWWSRANHIYLNENSSSMFSRLLYLFSVDLSMFDTGNVVYMTGIFYNCEHLEELDLSSWNTSNVINMGSMFFGLQRLEHLDISNFDTSNVTNMSYMFYNVSKITSLDLSSFDTSNVTDMRNMFAKMNEILELDLSHFNSGKVRDINYMFSEDSSLKTIIVGEDVDFSLNMKYKSDDILFYNCNNLVGGSGTKYINSGSEKNKVRFARVDYGTSEPGYFTSDKIMIKFNPNEGNISVESKYVKKDSSIGNLPTPFRDGYSFEGWYTESEGGTEINSNYVPDNNIELYAHWSVDNNPNLIQYFDNGDGIVGFDDYVKIGQDEFWVLSTTSDGNINLLAKYNLDSNYRQSEDNYDEITFSDYSYWRDSAATTDVGDESFVIFDDYKIYGDYNFNVYRNKRNEDTPNNLVNYVNNYKNHIKDDLGVNSIIDARIMTYEEANRIECSSKYNCFLNIFNQDYWLGTLGRTSYSSDHIFYASTYDNEIYPASYNESSKGVRPLIVISSDIIDKKYEITFDTSDIYDIGKTIYLQNSNDSNVIDLPELDDLNYAFDGWYSDENYNTKVGNQVVTNNNTTYYAKFDSCNGFYTDTWETIKENVSNNPSYYPVGCKKMVSYDSRDMVRIVNNTFPDECNKTDFSQTACGFVLEYVYIYTSSIDYLNLPESLLNVIIDTKSISNAFVFSSGESSNIENIETSISNDKIFLPSIKEIYGEDVYNGDSLNNTRQFDYYRKKGVSLDNFAAARKNSYYVNYGEYLLRDALRNYSNDHYNFIVSFKGNLVQIYGDGYYYIPFFRIGNQD